MIRIGEPRGPQPYPREIVDRALAKLAAYYETNQLERRQRRGVIDSAWHTISRPARDALEQYFHGKCAYCETRLGTASDFEIDMFRPTTSASKLDGKGSLDHYSWLAIEWHNLYAACAACNRAKRTLFHAVPGQGRARTADDAAR
jgi:hypothetical protein